MPATASNDQGERNEMSAELVHTRAGFLRRGEHVRPTVCVPLAVLQASHGEEQHASRCVHCGPAGT